MEHMKKQKLKNLFKIGALIFGISPLLWNCKKDSEPIESNQIDDPNEAINDFNPQIETFSLQELNTYNTFNGLKNNYNVLQNNIFAKGNSKTSARLVNTLGITIAANTIIVENLAYVRGGGNPFFGADALWTSFQDKTKEFVDNNAGLSSIVPPITDK